MFTEAMGQALGMLGVPVYPASTSAGTADTGSIDMSKARRALALGIVGTLGSSATFDMKWQVSKDNSTWTDLSVANAAATNYAITEVTANNQVVKMEIRADQLPAGYRYARARATVGVAASQICTLILGGEASAKPLSQNDNAVVVQNIAVGPN